MRVKGVHAACLTALALLPSVAAADSRVSVSRGTLTFFSEDVGVANRLTVEDSTGGRVRFFEPVDPFGMRFTSAPCDPGRLNAQANIVELFCTRRGFARVAIDIGDGEDVVEHTAAVPVSVAGGLGADRLRTGPGADTVSGGQGDDAIATRVGDDRVLAGEGADVVDGGPGDDGFQTADGDIDTVECGPGFDTVLADTVDRLTGCEGVTRQFVAPAGEPLPPDDTAPTLRATAPRRQRLVPRRPRVTVRVGTSEQALVRSSGYVSAGGVNSRLRIGSARITGPAEGGRIVVRLSPRHARRAAAALRRGRRASVRLTVSAVDRAGNTSRPRRLTIALSR